jgi:holliday junction DNA helicase RuvA
MIGYLSGKVIFETHDGVILNINGIGYSVITSERTRLWAYTHVGEVSFFVHTLVRENAFDLYGFETEQEIYFFKKLIDVSGIGPKSALGIVGLASPDTLYQSIINQNIDFLTSVPGVGKKTAERMCIELRDKLKDYKGNKESIQNENDRDVLDALLALGYSSAQAHNAVNSLDPNISERNERIKAALLKI